MRQIKSNAAEKVKDTVYVFIGNLLFEIHV